MENSRRDRTASVLRALLSSYCLDELDTACDELVFELVAQSGLSENNEAVAREHLSGADDELVVAVIAALDNYGELTMLARSQAERDLRELAKGADRGLEICTFLEQAELRLDNASLVFFFLRAFHPINPGAVSYTHLTLPTKA